MPELQLNLKDTIQKLVESGDTAAAVKILYDAVVVAARKKDFVAAEALRKQLYEVDDMALTEIVKSGEIIERERSAAIDPTHRQTWSSLYGSLNREEANALFFAMEEKHADIDQLIIAQGELLDGIVFINKGQAKVVWKDAGTEVLIATLNPGYVAGHDTFFDITMATTSIITLTPVDYCLLKKEKTADWAQAAPSLMDRLRMYCRRFETAGNMLKRKGIDRRKHQRFNLTGKVTLQILSSAGAPIGKLLKGELSNISAGGLSFEILLPNQKTALMLLGRNLRVAFSLGEGKSSVMVERVGTITSVTDSWQNEFAVHVRFDTPLPDSVTGGFSKLTPYQKAR